MHGKIQCKNVHQLVSVANGSSFDKALWTCDCLAFVPATGVDTDVVQTITVGCSLRTLVHIWNMCIGLYNILFA